MQSVTYPEAVIYAAQFRPDRPRPAGSDREAAGHRDGGAARARGRRSGRGSAAPAGPYAAHWPAAAAAPCSGWPAGRPRGRAGQPSTLAGRLRTTALPTILAVAG